MMGKYQNGYVLNEFQVCEECNSYFSNNLENKIGLDSYEAFLRMQYQTKPMSDGHHLSPSRIFLTGDEGIFKDLPFEVITDCANPYRVHFSPKPLIGIIRDVEKQEYDYYDISDLPTASAEVIARLKSSSNPIVNMGIAVEKLEPILIEKGYLNCSYKYTEGAITDFFSEPEFQTRISIKIDSLVRRVCAKTAFNYLCYTMGHEYALLPQFDAIRNYIRYDTWSEKLWFRYSRGPVSTSDMPNATLM